MGFVGICSHLLRFAGEARFQLLKALKRTPRPAVRWGRPEGRFGGIPENLKKFWGFGRIWGNLMNLSAFCVLLEGRNEGVGICARWKVGGLGFGVFFCCS